MTRFARSKLLLLAPLVALLGCGDSGTTEIDDPDGNGDAYDHGRAPGASANDLLAASEYDRLVVQVQYVEGARPSDAGLEHLRAFLSARLDKPAGIVVRAPEQVAAQPRATWSADDVRALEGQHRTVFTEGTTLAAYFLFVDGEFSEAANVLGIAYNNTSMAVFGEKIRQYTGDPVFQPSQGTVEGTVANHEFGHILGLVNNGSAMQNPHQDVENGHHCDNQQCLMYYTVRTTNFIDRLFDEGMPDLDANCLADLRANGGR